MSSICVQGFTLAELLISLAILGGIATFTIPKILMAQQEQQYNAKTKEAIATVAVAYNAYKLQNAAGTSTTAGNFIQYLNYSKIQTSGQVDDIYGYNTWGCSMSTPCYMLHNGGALILSPNSFAGTKAWAGTSTTDFIDFFFDPDGQVTDGTTNGPGKSLKFFLYYNGKVSDWCGAVNNNPLSSGCTGQPPWFSW